MLKIKGEFIFDLAVFDGLTVEEIERELHESPQSFMRNASRKELCSVEVIDEKEKDHG